MKHAIIRNGIVDTVHYTKPDHVETVEVPDHVFGAWRQNQDGTFSPPPENLEEAKRFALMTHEAQARDAKAKIVTPSMEALYLSKRLEAVECLDDPEPSRDRYKLLGASIGADVPDTGNIANDLRAAAGLILTRNAECTGALSDVESLRLWGKRAIEVCQSKDELDAVLGQIRWPA